MSAQKFFRSYSDERRQQTIEQFHREDFGDFVRYTPTVPGVDGMVMFSRLDASNAIQQIEAQIAHFNARGIGFEWKLYDLDEPANLRALLLELGFVAGDSEVFMVYSLGNLARPDEPSTMRYVRRVLDERGVRDVVAVQSLVWERRFDWLYGQLMTTLEKRPCAISIYCAYVDGQPVGSGWTDFPEGSLFPELHGGAVLAGWRRRGIYGELYRARLAEAMQRQYAQVTVDASPMSRPILQKLGFTYICGTTPMRHAFAQP